MQIKVTDLAKQVGLNRQTVANHIRDGKLRAVLVPEVVDGRVRNRSVYVTSQDDAARYKRWLAHKTDRRHIPKKRGRAITLAQKRSTEHLAPPEKRRYMGMSDEQIKIRENREKIEAIQRKREDREMNREVWEA